ncbi:unnamed protein product [Schistocephalus solidus]|uniref:Uncharacterized protein n=1 Tax=Schistocephalus solidus TaxID=70667 RepID=A0A183TJG8_SCHSO|nr:unnamed protein product [Schistocephalus solidus]
MAGLENEPQGKMERGPPGQRLSRTLQNRFACSNRRTSLQRTPKPALKLNLATSARMTMTQTATKELLFTSCDGRVAVDVQRVDQGRDPTEAHQPSTLPPVDSIEQTPEVPAYTDHVCQVCSASFTADTLLQVRRPGTGSLPSPVPVAAATVASGLVGFPTPPYVRAGPAFLTLPSVYLSTSPLFYQSPPSLVIFCFFIFLLLTGFGKRSLGSLARPVVE